MSIRALLLWTLMVTTLLFASPASAAEPASGAEPIPSAEPCAEAACPPFPSMSPRPYPR